MAEFSDPDALLAAARECAARHRVVEAYTPYPIAGLAEAVGFRRDRIPLCALLGGIAGGIGIYALQWYSAVVDYAINSGGRPLHSWPAFVPATFEVTILCASLAAFAGMLAANGLPRLNHPLFGATDFDLASQDRLFLGIRALGPAFDADGARTLLESLDPLRVIEVWE